MKWRWEHKPDRVPNLDRSDLETISLLVREFGNRTIPIFSKRLMQKVEKSLAAYRWEDGLLAKYKNPGIRTLVTWPAGTERYSNGPFF